MDQRKTSFSLKKLSICRKYSEAKKVSVCISQKNHHVDMSIRDDGRGFDTTTIFNGNGMNTLKKRGIELHADYTIQSSPHRGTVVQLNFKIT
jgi:nitrate/nitrite-specific signal transduction histidine kinase